MASEFSIRSDSVDVEQIMKQIRARIREKRGVDYTEEEIRELANVRLEKFLDPAKLRSDLLDHYRQRRPLPAATAIEVPPAPPNYVFEADTPYKSSRGAAGWLLFTLRRLLNPLLKLFINPNPIVHVIAMQSAFNAQTTARVDRLVEHLNTQWLHRENARRDMDALNYEVAHNLVLEMTRLSIEVKNMKMRVESISSRLDFAERRARALENVVQYRPGTGPAAESPRPVAPAQIAPAAAAAEPDASAPIKGEAQRKRRRRRRGRGGSSAVQGQPGIQGATPQDARNDEAGGDLFTQDGSDAGQDGPGQAPEPQVPVDNDSPRDPDPSS